MGFAAGFQVGQQAVERGLKMREEDKLKRELAQAYAKPETSQGYTAETGQQLEELAKTGAYDIVPQYAPAAEGQTQGVFTGYQAVPKAGLDLQGDMPAAPMSFNPQQVQDYGGRRVAGQFDPMQLQGLQMREAARVIGASGDPVRAAQMMAEATRMEREAVESPLRLEALRTQVESGKLGLKKSGFELTAAERADADAQKMTDFTAWRSQNPQADFATTTAKAQELGISIDQQFKIASNMTGIKEQAFKASQQRIEDIIRENPSLDGLLKSHKESKDLDPNSHFEAIRGQGDKVSLNRVNTATGEIIQPNVFTGNEAETTAYLNKAAMNPATIIDYTMNLEKNKAAIEKDRAYAEALGRRGTEEKGLAKKVQDAEAFLGRKLSEPEKLQLLGLAAKPRAAAEVRDADVISLSKELVNKPTGLMVDGKPTKHTQQTAITAARQMLEQQTAAADPVDALIASMKKNTPAATKQATPAGQSLINLSNAMLPAAAPAQTAPTTRQEQLRGLYLGQPRQQ